jgi:acyl carrier protein
MAMSHDEIYAKVKEVLVDALGVDEEEVTPSAVIKDDLGAESLDFLDISFRLEKAFGIKFGKELTPDIQNDATLVKDGSITPAGIASLKEKVPSTNFAELEKDPRLENMSKLFTVDTIVNFVEQKLKQTQAA